MAFATGTSTDYQDLLSDLRDLALVNGWQEGTATDEGRYVNSTEDEWIVTGTGGGSDVITVGIRTFTKADRDVRGWELMGCDSYTDANTWENQPGISPGRHDGAGTAAYGSYLSLCSRTMTYWWSVTSRRMCGAIMVGNVFQAFYLGWGSPFDTVGNYANPKFVAGATYDPLLRYADSDVHMTGPINPIGSSTSGRNGPAQLHNRAGSWVTVRNRNASDSNHIDSSSNHATGVTKRVYPCSQTDIGTVGGTADSWLSTSVTGTFSLHMGVFIPFTTAASNWPGTQSALLMRTPDPTSPKDTVKRLPAIVHDETELDIELDGMGWCSAAHGPNDPPLQPGDRLQDPNTSAFYRAFPMGAHAADWNWLWIEEK